MDKIFFSVTELRTVHIGSTEHICLYQEYRMCMYMDISQCVCEYILPTS